MMPENKNALISIVVPVYNVEEYLDKCVKSLTEQDYRDIEILLVDDGSKDSSGKLCDEWALRDNRITVFHKPNGGLSDARNYGLDNACGEYVMFVDSDDSLVANACSYLLDDALKNDADVVVGHAKLLRNSARMEIMENGIKKHFKYHCVYSGKEYILKCLETTDLRVEAWRSLYKREFLKKYGLRFMVGITHEDEEFTPRVLLNAKRVVLSDCSFYIYDNARPSSITNSDKMSKKRAFDRLKIYEVLLPLYRTVKPHKLKRRLLDNLCWKYLDCFSRYNLLSYPEFAPRRTEMLRNAYTIKRRLKALCFAVSPKLYYKLTKK